MQRLGRESGILKIYKYRGRCNASGNNIRRIREQKQWSQEQLAARLLQSASGRAAALIEEEAAKRGLRLKLGRLSVSAGWSA